MAEEVCQGERFPLTCHRTLCLATDGSEEVGLVERIFPLLLSLKMEFPGLIF
jgi:hypothetical protein